MFQELTMLELDITKPFQKVVKITECRTFGKKLIESDQDLFSPSFKSVCPPTTTTTQTFFSQQDLEQKLTESRFFSPSRPPSEFDGVTETGGIRQLNNGLKSWYFLFDVASNIFVCTLTSPSENIAKIHVDSSSTLL